MKLPQRVQERIAKARHEQRQDAALIANKVQEPTLHVARWAFILALVCLVSQIATCGYFILR